MQVEVYRQSQATVRVIDIQEILDYNYCSNLYKLKYLNEQVEENLTDKYDKTLRKCFYAYLNMLKNNSSVEVNYLTRLWGKYWIKDKSTLKLMTKASANSRDKYDVLRKSGIDSLISFHDMIKIGEQYPILVGKEYRVNITPTIILTGKFEYIREFNLGGDNHVFQIIKFNHKKDKYLTMYQMRHDLELTAMDYAFQSLFKIDEPQQMVYANIYKEKFVPSYRNQKDFEILKQTVINTVKCITNEIYNISPDSKCFMCSYRNQCQEQL